MQVIKALVLRELKLSDLDDYHYWNLPNREFHKMNGPYFKKKNEEELTGYIAQLRTRLESGESEVLEQKKIIANADTDEIIGEVNWYWKSEETLWMEIGIVIFNEKYWGKGLGYSALEKWVTEIFATRKNLVRLGMTTWSGNIPMMKLAEKLGFKCEAVYRKARIVEGKYYDSVSYGILREEWDCRGGGENEL